MLPNIPLIANTAATTSTKPTKSTKPKAKGKSRSRGSTSRNRKTNKKPQNNNQPKNKVHVGGPTKTDPNVERPLAPVWTNLTDPGLAPADVYSKGGVGSSVSTANSLKIDSSIANALKGGASFINKLNTAVKFYNDIKGMVNSGFSLERLDSLSPSIKSALTGFGVDAKSDLFKQIEKTSEYMVRIGKSIHKVKNTNFSDINSVVSLMNGLTNEKDGLFVLKDVSAQAQYTINLVNQMTRMGIPNSLASVRDLVKGSPLLLNIVQGILPTTLKFLDTEGLATIDTLLSGDLIKSIRSSFVSDIAKGFDEHTHQHWGDRTEREWFTRFKEIAQLIDNDAFYSNRNGQRILDLSQLLDGTSTFLEMLQKGSLSEKDDMVYLGLASFVDKSDVRSELAKQMSNVVWIDDSVAVNHYPRADEFLLMKG